MFYGFCILAAIFAAILDCNYAITQLSNFSPGLNLKKILDNLPLSLVRPIITIVVEWPLTQFNLTIMKFRIVLFVF